MTNGLTASVAAAAAAMETLWSHGKHVLELPAFCSVQGLAQPGMATTIESILAQPGYMVCGQLRYWG
jgi:hypothetical protein